MQGLKATGGLTRGRGMSETQRLVWVMSMPACADINNDMQSLTDTNFKTSEQHTSTSEQHTSTSEQHTVQVSSIQYKWEAQGRNQDNKGAGS